MNLRSCFGGAVAAVRLAVFCSVALALPAWAKHEVGVYCDNGPAGIGAYQWFCLVNDAPDLNLTLVDGADIRAGALDKLEMLVMPGGSSKDEYLSLKDEGMEKIRAFIRNGGGYIGTCAGCFLVCDQDRGAAKRMHIVPVLYKNPPSGTIFLNHKFTPAGKAALGITNDTWSVRFHGGTVMKPSTNTIEDAKFEVWAKYASDADAKKPVTSTNSVSGYDAILGGTYGKGRVVVFGAHPEYFAGTVGLVDAAFRWVLDDKSVKTVRRYRKPGARPVAFVQGGQKDGAQAAVTLNSSDAYDVFPVTSETIRFNELEHVDLVVFASGKMGFDKGEAKQIFADYLRNGGKAVVHKKGKDILEEVSEALAGDGVTQVPDGTNLIAHRGESFDAPENTLPAYKMAVDRGFGFECDIYRSKDGRLFTFHDPSLKRTTGGANTNLCTAATWAEIEKCNVGGWGKWKGSKYDGTRPALLEEVLALARPGRKIYVEVKGDDAAVGWVGAIRETVARSAQANPETILFICFSAKTCAELRRQMPDYKIYWLCGQQAGNPRSAESVLKTLRDCGATGVDMKFVPEVVTAEYVRAIRDAGFEFHAWTIDDPNLAREAFRRGVQTVTTNRAQYLQEH